MANALTERIRRWRAERAEHSTTVFLPASEVPLLPEQGYVRLWFVEAFLADRTRWGSDQFPALHGGLSLDHAGSTDELFSMFARAPEPVRAPGAQQNFPLTPLLP